ncbi:hypothetical protein PCASD_09411 [Puccinia coronata f. sp. avenae]|uniref:Uncharacterized protein n=1 Tax=Puccinia coronata f. sp. avenae TaxID=200324 RepID=A0A2N5UHP2_9BASI|nr:hypothetical protein PCASD_09411 [Puccinia coronata f. sp. avenae]
MTSGFFEAYARLIDSNWFLLDEERIIVHEGRSRACFRDNHSSFTFILGLVHITVLAKHQQVVRPLVGALLGRFLTPRTSKQASASAVIYSSVYSNTTVNSLYQLDAVDAASVIIPSILTYSAPQTPAQSMSPVSTSSHPSVPPRSHTVPPPTASFSFPVTANSADPMAPQRTIPKRAPTPPPPVLCHAAPRVHLSASNMNKFRCPKRRGLRQSKQKLAEPKKRSPNGIELMMPSNRQGFDRSGTAVMGGC